MILTLLLRDEPIGTVDLRGTTGTRREGLLKPAPAYAAARSALQTLTVGMLGRPDISPDTIGDAIDAAMRALIERGLALRDPDGAPVAVRLIYVGDYFPAELEPSMLDGSVRFPVVVELA